MSEQYTPNIGHTPGDDARRDAIHIALAPVIADHDMWPGAHIGPTSRGTFGEECDRCAGIADPFRNDRIEKGDRIWIMLYPGSISSLRHVFTHWAFRPKVPGQE